MIVEPTAIPDVKLIRPRRFEDARGYFMETWNDRIFREQVADVGFVQDNFSLSRAGTLRGLHYQIRQPQGKLVRVVSGAVFDVAVDLRRSSGTFGQWVGVELSEQNQHQLFVPEGFGHGFIALTELAGFAYKCTDFYSQPDERTIRWDDPELAIDWPVGRVESVIVSDKDAQGDAFLEADLFR